MNKHIKRIPLYSVLSIIIIFLIVWIASLLKCEFLTHKYYDEFEFAYQNNAMITDVEYFKVLNCDGNTAEVYYVSDTCGDVLEFVNQNGVWVENGWRTIWSKSGSASDVVWPYWCQLFVTGF
ncbi:MAG: hypothetical protein IJB76_06840 [Clostridia bacterium]|nr:hypothetical protein [Clostridia bacterium]